MTKEQIKHIKLLRRIEQVKNLKHDSIRSQRWEDAAKFRDEERELLRFLKIYKLTRTIDGHTK